MPGKIERQKDHATALDALAVTLARFATGTRVKTLSEYLHICWAPSKISNIVNATLAFIKTWWGNFIDLDTRFFATPADAEHLAKAISERPGLPKVPYNFIVGFIDGTSFQICRPTEDQESYYNGNERHHCLRYQGLVLPNGIMAGMFGPYPRTYMRRYCGVPISNESPAPYPLQLGASNDKGLYTKSKWENALEALFHGTDYMIYGDAGYGLSTRLAPPLRPCDNHEHYAEINQAMSSVRVAVEMAFGDIKNNFNYLQNFSQLKVGLNDIGFAFMFGAFMCNILTCIHRSNRISGIFQLVPPTLEYLPLDTDFRGDNPEESDMEVESDDE